MLAQLREGGTEVVTMRRVAAAAGLSLGALRENWPTREALLDSTVRYVISQREDRFQTVLFARRIRDATFLWCSSCTRRSSSWWAGRAVAHPDRPGYHG